MPNMSSNIIQITSIRHENSALLRIDLNGHRQNRELKKKHNFSIEPRNGAVKLFSKKNLC